MFLSCNKYLYRFIQKKNLSLLFLLTLSTAGYSQNKLQETDTILSHQFNPIFVAAFKTPYTLIIPHSGYSYRNYWKRPSKELLYWPNYPLTTAQIEARDSEWERRNKQTIGGQIISDIASDIIKNQVNSLIYGKKMPVAVAPKF